MILCESPIEKCNEILAILTKSSIGAPCVGFHEVLEQYEHVKECVHLSGPTSLVPIIKKSVEITVQHGGYHILLVIMDGQIEEDQDESTQFAIVEASLYPLSIIMVGVGKKKLLMSYL